jgi:pilus assembly protein TadC
MVGFTTPNLESALLKAAATLPQAIGIDVNVVGPVARTAVHHFEMKPYDTGIRVAFVLSAFGWFAAALRGARPIQLAANAGYFALLAIPVQFFGVLIALILLSAGWPDAADAWLLHGVWLVTALGAILVLRARGVLKA